MSKTFQISDVSMVIFNCFTNSCLAAPLQHIVQVPGPKKWIILGVSLTHLVESRDLFFLEAEVVDNIF